jgi:hypothetical protein
MIQVPVRHRNESSYDQRPTNTTQQKNVEFPADQYAYIEAPKTQIFHPGQGSVIIISNFHIVFLLRARHPSIHPIHANLNHPLLVLYSLRGGNCFHSTHVSTLSHSSLTVHHITAQRYYTCINSYLTTVIAVHFDILIRCQQYPQPPECTRGASSIQVCYCSVVIP